MCFSNFGEFHSCSKRLCYSAMMTLAGRKKKRREEERKTWGGWEKKVPFLSFSHWKVEGSCVCIQEDSLPLSLTHTLISPLLICLADVGRHPGTTVRKRKEWEMYPKWSTFTYTPFAPNRAGISIFGAAAARQDDDVIWGVVLVVGVFSWRWDCFHLASPLIPYTVGRPLQGRNWLIRLFFFFPLARSVRCYYRPPLHTDTYRGGGGWEWMNKQGSSWADL